MQADTTAPVVTVPAGKLVEANAASRPAKRGRAAVHPDQEAAAARISDAFGAVLGTDVRVRPRGAGYKVEIAFDDLDEALALARRLRPRAVA